MIRAEIPLCVHFGMAKFSVVLCALNCTTGTGTRVPDFTTYKHYITLQNAWL